MLNFCYHKSETTYITSYSWFVYFCRKEQCQIIRIEVTLHLFYSNLKQMHKMSEFNVRNVWELYVFHACIKHIICCFYKAFDNDYYLLGSFYKWTKIFLLTSLKTHNAIFFQSIFHYLNWDETRNEFIHGYE